MPPSASTCFLRETAAGAVKRMTEVLKQLKKVRWDNTTDWSVFFEYIGATRTYMAAPVDGDVNKLRRDGACIALLTNLNKDGPPNCTIEYPFRSGPAAMNGMESYKMCHTAWAAAYELDQFIVTHEQTFLSQAVTRLVQTDWPHDTTLCPPQLEPQFKEAALALMLLSLYAHNLKPPAARRKESGIAACASLFFVRGVVKARAIPKLLEAVNLLLATEVALHFMEHKEDPRLQPKPVTDATACAAVATIQLAFPILNDVCCLTQFVKIVSAVERKDLGAAMLTYARCPPLLLTEPTSKLIQTPYLSEAIKKLKSVKVQKYEYSSSVQLEAIPVAQGKGV